MQKISAVKGMDAILPDESHLWQRLEREAAAVFHSFGYRQIRLPLVERTELFSRAIGDATEVVEKQMYTFPDKKGTRLTLRPEGTAGCVRACADAGLLNTQQRLWYGGPMFRYERPQKGRQRQFHQLGVEFFGAAAAEVEAELIMMGEMLWRRLGINDVITLEINTLGDAHERAAYRDELVMYLRDVAAELDEDSQRRLDTNPLRILDSKVPQTQALLQGVPTLERYVQGESAEHFARLRQLLDANKVKYTVNPRLVRGLDYYNRTVFEWTTESLGAQGAVCGGGRYDGLVKQLGGPDTPAAGFAMGMERLIMMLQPQAGEAPVIDLYVATTSEDAYQEAFCIAKKLRDEMEALKIATHAPDRGGIKSLMKKAGKSGADYMLILGDDELKEKKVRLKPLTETAHGHAAEWKVKLDKGLDRNSSDYPAAYTYERLAWDDEKSQLDVPFDLVVEVVKDFVKGG